MEPKPDLTSLPDIPSCAILSYLPLQQLIVSLPLLHPRFTTIRESVLKQNQRLVLNIGNREAIQQKKSHSGLGLPFAGHLRDSKGDPRYPETDFYNLNLANLTEKAVQKLSTCMPQLVHLEVAIASVDLAVILQLTALLNIWAPTLENFKLTVSQFALSPAELEKLFLPTVASYFRDLMQLINRQLLSLERLSLDIDDCFVDRYKHQLSGKIGQGWDDVMAWQALNRAVPLNGPLIANVAPIEQLTLLLQEAATYLGEEGSPVDLVLENMEHLYAQAFTLIDPLRNIQRFTSDQLFSGDGGPYDGLSVLGRLREFSLASGRASSALQPFLLGALQKYASTKLKSIAISEAGYQSKWSLASTACSHYASCFTRLPRRQLSKEVPNDTPYLHLFTSLREYSLHWPDLTPNQGARLRALSSLPKLECLLLNGFTQATPLLNVSFTELPPFSSVTVLHLIIYRISLQDPHFQAHEALQAPYWAHLFPAVQIISIENGASFCTSCRPDVNRQVDWTKDAYEKMKACLKQLLAPLKVLPGMRRIFYRENGKGILALTPEGDWVQATKYY